MPRIGAMLAWAAVAAAVMLPLGIAAASPLMAWRGPVYIAACLAGVAALGLILVQPLLAGGYLPGLAGVRGRRVHRGVGLALVAAIVLHVGGLWLTSPPDVIDALTFTSPTPFSAWGVVAMWTLFGAALLAVLRRPLRIAPRLWRPAHSALVAVTVAGSVVHALLIEGTMGPLSKTLLCALAVAATLKALRDLRAWSPLLRRRA
ncbi:ferric reductase [Thetidibacter halocola]|uniref:Ferric reductase n=1 Tax=Thetidibacter halocola TaxID=2827239 RepID=A0A8J8BB14_9RHOB|nr:ferric reductase [Thetidibacter halocola]MBS0125778.1 ferric reductase [Thetidibacter halocola]